MKRGSLTIFALLFLFSAVWAVPSSWPYFHPNSGQTSIIVPDQIDTSWQVNLGDSVYVFPTVSPVTGWINGIEAIFVPTSCGVFALDANDGHTIWTYATTDSLKYAPLYLDSAHLYVSVGDSLIGLNPQTGQHIWSSSLESQGFHVVSLSSGKISVINASGKLFVFDFVHPDSSWQIGPLPGGGCDNIAPVRDSQGYVYVVTLGTMLSDFNLCKVSPSGDLAYSPDYLFYEPGGVRMTPGLKYDSILIFGTHTTFGWTSSIYNYRTSDHQQTWRRSFIYSDGPVFSSPAIDNNGNVYCATANFVIALDSSNHQRWTYSCQLNASSSVIDGNHKIIFGTADGHLSILNSGGIAIHDFVCDGDLCSPAIGSDGSIYIAGNHSVYKFGDVVVAQYEPRSARGLSGIKIYPNPFSQRLTINHSSCRTSCMSPDNVYALLF